MAASSRLGVLMKLDKNQRKPRVFKASDLCPYYNRRVYSSYYSCCFHIYQLHTFHILEFFMGTLILFAVVDILSLFFSQNYFQK